MDYSVLASICPPVSSVSTRRKPLASAITEFCNSYLKSADPQKDPKLYEKASATYSTS